MANAAKYEQSVVDPKSIRLLGALALACLGHRDARTTRRHAAGVAARHWSRRSFSGEMFKLPVSQRVDNANRFLICMQ